MATGSNAFYSQQYATAVELLAQQLTPRVASLFTPMSAVGKSATVVNQIDAFEADERSALYDSIVFAAVTHNRPWVYPRHFDKAIPFDSIEQMQMNANPQSQYVQGVVGAINRKMDDEAIRAFFADRLLGESAGTTDSFASGFQVSVNTGGTTSGMNVEKVQNALQILRENEVMDGEQIHCVISPKQERNLMNEIEVTSSDFTAKMIIDRGTMVASGFMGINWVISNRLLTDANSYRRVPFFTSKGMAFATWDGGMKTTVNQRVDLRGQPWQVYGEGHFGCVRRDAKKVIEIKCSEA
ncbi:MAG: hypothetical protein RLZZ373_2682 [Pseudomonadota bacterium]|jgi:hypothetical protein